MANPLYRLFDEEHAACYHVASRCVRGGFLSGFDRYTESNYDYRRRWVANRIEQLARSFAVEVFGYAVMSQHFHVVLGGDPKACESWSDGEVARRWAEVSDQLVVMGDDDRLAHARRTLASPSGFMRRLKQPIARRANAEDGCAGHFFEQRYYSGALLNEAGLRAATRYVELDPNRAHRLRQLIACGDASLGERLREHSEERLARYLGPLASRAPPAEPKLATPSPLPVSSPERR